jgi:2-dehydro-3-deoxyphosphogluconate aldolase/(4S)-4-hydroxy-2-oxoglutarate aldolase
MPVVFSRVIAGRLRASGVVAVVVLKEPEHALPLGRALLAGGVGIIELTLRTPGSSASCRN